MSPASIWSALPPCLACRKPIRLVEVRDSSWTLWRDGVTHPGACTKAIGRFIADVETATREAA